MQISAMRFALIVTSVTLQHFVPVQIAYLSPIKMAEEIVTISKWFTYPELRVYPYFLKPIFPRLQHPVSFLKFVS